VRPAIHALASITRVALATTGAGAALTATAAGGGVTGVTVGASGSGYPLRNRLVFGGPGEFAQGVVHVDGDAGGAVSRVAMVAPGRDYASPPAVSVQPYLNYVYDEIPAVFSESAPFMWFAYAGGENAQTAYGNRTQRIWTLDAIACQCLMQETDQAEHMTREFVGVFYELVAANRKLNETCDDAMVIRDEVRRVPLKGVGSATSQYLANVFAVQMTEYSA
jgi:hypothetical protein